MQSSFNLNVPPPSYGFQSNYARTKKYLDSIIADERIMAVLGRPIKRKIIDKEHHVILNVGDLITAEAVILAKQADTLDSLLDSVYW